MQLFTVDFKCSLFNVKTDIHLELKNLNPIFCVALIASIFKAAFKYDTKDEQPIWCCLHNIGKLVLMCGIIA